MKFGKFDSCESFTMAQGPKDKGEKRNASDMEGAPAERAAHGSVKELLLEQCGKTDGLSQVRNDFKESLAQQAEQHERCMERLRRDADAGEQGNKWHKGINIQLDLHEDAGRHLKRAEEKISRILLAH